jgi:ATPase subunit of ABC transporter with duplicated ATPase domains
VTEALRCYRGAPVVASHDARFLRELELTRWLRLGDALDEIEPL